MGRGDILVQRVIFKIGGPLPSVVMAIEILSELEKSAVNVFHLFVPHCRLSCQQKPVPTSGRQADLGRQSSFYEFGRSRVCISLCRKVNVMINVLREF